MTSPICQAPTADDALLVHRALIMTRRSIGAYARIRALLLRATDTMLLSRYGRPDERFWSDYRTALIAAGATESDLRFVATLAVLLIGQCQTDSSDDRDEQIELIARHLVEADITTRMRGALVLSVAFPGQETH